MAEPEEKQEVKLTSENMQAIFLILLKHAGGRLVVPDEVLTAYPKEANFAVQHDDVDKLWHIFIPRKRTRRKLILPQKTLIKPN